MALAPMVCIPHATNAIPVSGKEIGNANETPREVRRRTRRSPRHPHRGRRVRRGADSRTRRRDRRHHARKLPERRRSRRDERGGRTHRFRRCCSSSTAGRRMAEPSSRRTAFCSSVRSHSRSRTSPNRARARSSIASTPPSPHTGSDVAIVRDALVPLSVRRERYHASTYDRFLAVKDRVTEIRALNQEAMVAARDAARAESHDGSSAYDDSARARLRRRSHGDRLPYAVHRRTSSSSHGLRPGDRPGQPRSHRGRRIARRKSANSRPHSTR